MRGKKKRVPVIGVGGLSLRIGFVDCVYRVGG